MIGSVILAQLGVANNRAMAAAFGHADRRRCVCLDQADETHRAGVGGRGMKWARQASLRPISLHIPWTATVVAFVFLYAPSSSWSRCRFNATRPLGCPLPFHVPLVWRVVRRTDMIIAIGNSVIVGAGAVAGRRAARASRRNRARSLQFSRQGGISHVCDDATGAAGRGDWAWHPQSHVLASVPLSLTTVVIGQGTA